MGRYRFNREQLKFIEDKKGVKGWIRIGAKYFIASVLLAVLYYIILSLFVSTDQERRLARENRVMEEEYDRLQEKIEILDNTVKNLQVKDKDIYNKIFNADPPSLSNRINEESGFFSGMDTTRNDEIISYSSGKIAEIEIETAGIDKIIKDINKAFVNLGGETANIPSIVPIRDFSIGQTGASAGKKINPFYKTVVMHGGIDLLGATGTDVLASANGVVELVSRKGKKEGNMIRINHGNGYVTNYMHLGDIMVRVGQRVDQGMVIGRIGVSGMSFAPHLHYEVLYNEECMDPVNYFFADLSPALFKEVVEIASNTGQSLD